MKHRIVCLLIFLGLFASAALAVSEEEWEENVGSFTSGIMETFGVDKKSIIKALGKPVNAVSEKMPNEHNQSVMDIIDTLEYDGLDIELYTATQSKRIWVTRLVCTSDRYALNGVKVGDPVSKVLKALGEPSERTADKVVYANNYIDLTLTFGKNGIINKVDCTLWLD